MKRTHGSGYKLHWEWFCLYIRKYSKKINQQTKLSSDMVESSWLEVFKMRLGHGGRFSQLGVFSMKELGPDDLSRSLANWDCSTVLRELTPAVFKRAMKCYPIWYFFLQTIVRVWTTKLMNSFVDFKWQDVENERNADDFQEPKSHCIVADKLLSSLC